MSLQPKRTLSFDDWLEGERAALTDRVPLASIDCTLALTEVYDKLEVGPA